MINRVFKFGFIVMGLMCLSGAIAAEAADKQTPKQKPLQGKELEQAVQLNDVYARHLYATSCVERQKAYFLPPILSPEERASRLASYKASCDCQTDHILKTVKPNGLIGYVTSMNGSQIPSDQLAGRKPRELDGQTKALYAKIMYVNKDKNVRKKCGFKQ